MIVNLARTVTVPDGPNVDTSGLKAMLRPILGSTLFWWSLLALGLLALYLSPRTRRVTKLVALAIMAAIVVGWDSDRHVLSAAVGPQNADTALMVGLAIGTAWALLRGPRDRVPQMQGGQQGPSGKGRRRGFFGRRGR